MVSCNNQGELAHFRSNAADSVSRSQVWSLLKARSTNRTAPQGALNFLFADKACALSGSAAAPPAPLPQFSRVMVEPSRPTPSIRSCRWLGSELCQGSLFGSPMKAPILLLVAIVSVTAMTSPGKCVVLIVHRQLLYL